MTITAPPPLPRPAVPGHDPEALIPEARARQQQRRERTLALTLIAAVLIAGIYGLAQSVFGGRAAPAYDLGSCAAAVGLGPGGATGVPVYGLFRANDLAVRPALELTRVDPITLRAQGKSLLFPHEFRPWALAPDASSLLGGINPAASPARLINLGSMSIDRSASALITSTIGNRAVMDASWPTARRIVLLLQTFTPGNIVATRTLVGINATTGKTAWTHSLTAKRGLFAMRTVAGKIVIVLSDGDGTGGHLTVIVASPNGRLLTSALKLPSSGPPAASLVATTATTPSAYLVTDANTVYSINLQTARTTRHTVVPPLGAPASSAPFRFPAALPLGNSIAATGIFAREPQTTRAGLYLINPTTWTARLLAPDTPSIVSNGDTLATLTIDKPPACPSEACTSHPGQPLTFSPFGEGQITVYNEAGQPISRLAGINSFNGVQLTPSVGYGTFDSRYRGPLPRQHFYTYTLTAHSEFVFDPATGAAFRPPLRLGVGPELIYPGASVLSAVR